MKNKDSYYLLDNEVKYYPTTQMVHHVDSKIHLTDFQHKLLIYFLEHPGKIRTQYEICQQVWPNKVTTVDAFNKPLGAIRNALSNNQKAKKNHFIKTWSREGYSLECSCEFIGQTKRTKSLEPILKPAIWLTLVIMLTAVLTRLLSDKPVYEVTNLRRLTSLKGLAAEPSINDSGTRVAFTFYDSHGKGKILAKHVNQRDHVILTRGHNDKMPSLSPTGDRLLYQRLENGQCQVRLLYLNSALQVTEDKKLIHCSPSSFFVSMSWHDSSSFYYTDSSSPVGPYSIYRFDLKTGLSTLYLAPEAKTDYEHNGFARIVYHRQSSKLYIIHTRDWLNSQILMYHKDNLSHITSVNTAIGSIGTVDDTVIYKDNSNRLVLGSQKSSLTTQFNRPIMHPVTSQKSNSIAYSIGHIYQWNIFSYQLDNGKLTQLTFNNAANRYPVKNQEHFYYSSNFTGITQIYRQAKETKDQPIQLSNFKQNKSVHHLTVSADGKTLAISITKNTELYTISGTSLTFKQRLPNHVYPSFSPDSKRLLLSKIDEQGDYRVIEYSLADLQPTDIAINDARFAVYHKSGLIFNKNGQRGLYLFINGQVDVIDPEVEVFKPVHLAVADDAVYVIDRSDKFDKQLRKLSLNDNADSVLPIENAGQLSFHQGTLYYTLEQMGESSIYVGEIQLR